jgi:hypothetical protein
MMSDLSYSEYAALSADADVIREKMSITAAGLTLSEIGLAPLIALRSGAIMCIDFMKIETRGRTCSMRLFYSSG